MNTRGTHNNRSMIKCNQWLLSGALALLLLLPISALAGGVVTTCTEAALRAAMAGGGTVTFACDGTITLASTITNTLDTTLDGSGHQVVISGAGAVRVFCVQTNVSFQVVNLTIANGLGRIGGGILNLGGNVVLNGSQIQANVASCETETQSAGSAAGGGIFNQAGTLLATNCSFSSNQARQQTGASSDPSRTRGGALYNQSGQVWFQNCSFHGNSASGAPGPFNIRGTAHDASGGAIANSGTLTAVLCNFVANSSIGGIGGDLGGEGGPGNGGAVWNAGNLELRNSTVVSNTALGGVGGAGGTGMGGYPPGPGGMGGQGGWGNGGGLFNAGVATVANCTFSGNIGRGGDGGTGGPGGGFVGPPHQISRGGDGGTGGQGGSAAGAVCDINALCLLTNCTISSNFAIVGAGGAGGAGGYGSPSGSTGPGGVAGQSLGSLRSIGAILVKTTLAGNAPGGNCSGTFTDGGQNYSTDCSCAFTNSTPPKSGLPARPPFYLLHNFTGQETSYVDAHPFAPLLPAADGQLYGVTAGGAWPGAGAAYRIGTNGIGSGFAIVRAFGNDPTFGPAGALAASGSVLFGTTVEGGQTNLGTVYRVNADGTGYQVLHSFGSPGDGAMPRAGVLLVGSTLFGTTESGGSSGLGTIFRIETNGSGYSILNHFLGGTNGSGPAAELLISAGTLYGTTWSLGQTNGSTVFKINTDGSGFGVLKHFENPASAPHPWAGLAVAGSTLFGTTDGTDYWGVYGCGSIFKINTDGSGFMTLKQFPGSDGPSKHAALIVSGALLFGTTSGDNSLTNYGTVFVMNTDGSGYTVLKRFVASDGAVPNGDLLLQGNTLYGTTYGGGFYDAGVVFALSLSPPAILSLPQSQTAELGQNVEFTAASTGLPVPACQWFFNGTLVTGATDLSLRVPGAQFSQSGVYTLVVSSAFGSVTSAPVLFNVIPPVQRRPIPAVQVLGTPGSLLHVDFANALDTTPTWLPLNTVSLVTTSQPCPDLTDPLPPQRFYRAWQTGSPPIRSSLNLSFAPALTLTGAIGNSIRVDYINRYGPIDAWVTLNTVTLTNSSQLYFDTSAVGQPARLYRLVPVP